MPVDVLHVSQPHTAGVARCVADLVEDQLARGLSVAVASPPGGELQGWVEEAGAAYLRWSAIGAPGPTVPGETLRLARLIGRTDPALVHLHAAKAGLAGRLALRRRRPTVFQPHSWSFEGLRGPVRAAAIRWERIGTRWTDRLICVSEAERERGLDCGISAATSVVPNGVDLARFPYADPEERERTQQLLGLEPPVVVCPGRLHVQKGHDVLLEAWPLVLAEVPAAQLVLVGDGPERERLEALGTPRTTFAGASADMARWLRAADVVALPSRWEGMSLVLLEAMASGCSVVSTDVHGALEALGDPSAIVPVAAPAELAAVLVRRLRDPELRASEGAAARRRVEAAHSLEVTVRGIAEVYERVLAERRA